MGFCVHKGKKNKKIEVSIFHSPLALLKVSPLAFKAKHSNAHLLGAGLKDHDVELEPLTPCGKPQQL